MIELDREGDVFVLRMRAGENRFSLDWLDGFTTALIQVQATEGPVALVTTGEGKFYSNGMDLDWLATVPEQAGDYLIAIYRLLGRVLSFPAITVAAEKVMDSPTRVSELITASFGSIPRRSASRTRNTRNSP